MIDILARHLPAIPLWLIVLVLVALALGFLLMALGLARAASIGDERLVREDDQDHRWAS